MKTLKLLTILRDYPLFTENDVAKIVAQKPASVKTLLHRLAKQGLIFRIERGKYTAHDDALLVASLISPPSYLSLWTALRYHNLTEQLPRTIFVMVPRPRKPLLFQNTRIEFTKTKYFFGFRKERYRDFTIFVADPEKAVIDSLLSKKVPLDEIAKAIQTKALDSRKLIGDAIKTGNNALLKRLGFLLEENKIDCTRLKKRLDANYVLLDALRGGKGKKNREWGVIDNRA